MPTQPGSTRSPSFVGRSATLVGLLAIALSLITLAAAGASALLPVSIGIASGRSTVFAVVDLAAAAAVVLLISVATRVAALWFARLATLSEGRERTLRYLELSQTSSITLVLVALLNGVTEAAAIIALYALAAGAIGLLWLHGREPADRAGSPWPYSAGAAIGVVPWGVVALYQVVAIVANTPPPAIVRVVTLVLLALAAVTWWLERRRHLSPPTSSSYSIHEFAHALVAIGNGLALLVLAVGLSRPSALL